MTRTRNLQTGATRTRAGLAVTLGDTLRGALPIGDRGRMKHDALTSVDDAGRRELRRPAGYVVAAVSAVVVGAPQLVAALERWLR